MKLQDLRSLVWFMNFQNDNLMVKGCDPSQISGSNKNYFGLHTLFVPLQVFVLVCRLLCPFHSFCSHVSGIDPISIPLLSALET